MKRLLTLTLYLLATASTFSVQADPCDNLRNNQQAYRDCVNDWYGRSNKGSSPTPWWKNYDPNAGSGSAPAEAPTLSKQQQIDLQLQRERQQREAEREAAEEKRKQDQAAANFEAAWKRIDELHQKGQQLLRAGKPSDAMSAFQNAQSILKRYGETAFGDDRACLTYEGMGQALVAIGYANDAEDWFKKSVAIQNEHARLSPRLSEYFASSYNRSLNALAEYYESQGRFDDAADLHNRRYNHTIYSLGEHHPEAQKAFKALGYVLHKKLKHQTNTRISEHRKKAMAAYEAGQYTEATEEFRSILKLETSLEFNPFRDVGEWDAAHYNLGMSLLALKNYAEAEPMLKAALAIREHYKVELAPKLLDYGPREISLRNRLNALADLYERQQQFAKAEPYRRRIVELLEKTRAPGAETMKSLNNLGANLHQQKRYEEAESLYKRGLALAEKGKDTGAQATLQENLAYLQRQRAASAPTPEPPTSTPEKTQDTEWETANKQLQTHNAEAGRAYNTQQYDQAIVHGRAALALAQKHHIAVGSAQHDLALYYRAAQQPAEAETLFKQAIETFEKSRPDNTWAVKPLFDLATLYDQQKRFANSEPLYTRALAILDKNRLGANKTLALPIVKALSRLYRDTQRPDEAEQLEDRYGQLLAGK